MEGDIVVRAMLFGQAPVPACVKTLEEAAQKPQYEMGPTRYPYYITLAKGSFLLSGGYMAETVLTWYGNTETLSVWRRNGPRKLPMNKFHSEPLPLP